MCTSFRVFIFSLSYVCFVFFMSFKILRNVYIKIRYATYIKMSLYLFNILA